MDRRLKDKYTFDVWADSTLTNLFMDLGAYQLQNKKYKIKITTKRFQKIVEGIYEYIPEDIYLKLKEDYEDSIQNNRRFVYYAVK